MTADHRKPAEIEAEIAAERARLSRDLDVLQERLTVEGLMDEVRLQVRSQINDVSAQVRGQVGQVANEVAVQLRDQVGTAGQTVARTAKENPWPVAVIGLGLAWLAASALKPAHRAAKPKIGMAPVKPAVPSKPAHYDYSPADMAAAHLEEDADQWAEAVLGTGSNPISPYDPEPAWARDPESVTTRSR